MPNNVIGKILQTVSSFVNRARGSIFIATSEKCVVPTIHQNHRSFIGPNVFDWILKKQTQVKYQSEDNRFSSLWIHNDLCSQCVGIKENKTIKNTYSEIFPYMRYLQTGITILFCLNITLIQTNPCGCPVMASYWDTKIRIISRVYIEQ